MLSSGLSGAAEKNIPVRYRGGEKGGVVGDLTKKFQPRVAAIIDIEHGQEKRQ